MKKIFSLILALSISLSMCTSAFAAEANISTPPSTLSQEEYEQAIAQLEAENAQAEALWQQALAESQRPENVIYNTPDNAEALVAPYGNYRVLGAFDSYYYQPAMSTAEYTMTLTYKVDTNNYGSEVFGEIRSIDAYGNTSETEVIVNDYEYTRLDAGRTIAVNYSLRIGVPRWDNVMCYFTKVVYVEFYISGSSRVY